MAAKLPGVERKPREGWKQVTVLVKSGVSDNERLNSPELKHSLLDCVDLTVPCKILATGESPLDSTTEGLLQGFVADEYGNPHLVRIGALIMSGIVTSTL